MPTLTERYIDYQTTHIKCAYLLEYARAGLYSERDTLDLLDESKGHTRLALRLYREMDDVGISPQLLEELEDTATQRGAAEANEIIRSKLEALTPEERATIEANVMNSREARRKQIKLEGANRHPEQADAEVIRWWVDEERALEAASARLDASARKPKGPLDHATRPRNDERSPA